MSDQQPPRTGVNNWDVLKRMSEQNKDIRLGLDLTEARWSKKGSLLTFGAPGNVLLDIESGKLWAAVLLWDAQQFEDVKREMRAEPPSGDACLGVGSVSGAVHCAGCRG